MLAGGKGLIGRQEGVAKLFVGEGCVSQGHGDFWLGDEELVKGGGGELDGGEVRLVEEGVGEVALG